jgi:hypothetical protein
MTTLERVALYTPIWILWIDSTLDGGWKYHNDLDFKKQRHRLRCHTIGFVTNVDTDSVTVHQSQGTETHKGNDKLTVERITIPRRSILRWGFVTFGPNENTD